MSVENSSVNIVQNPCPFSFARCAIVVHGRPWDMNVPFMNLYCRTGIHIR